MKKILLFAILSLCLILCLSSCTFLRSFFTEMEQEATKVAEFTQDMTQLMTNPTVEEAEKLVHPSSPLSPEAVIDKIKGNEKLANIDMSNLDIKEDVTVGDITNLNISYHDATLGGNIYTADCEIVINGTPILVKLKLLSTDEGFGLYDFDLQ